jgi:molecular chaperone GrpE
MTDDALEQQPGSGTAEAEPEMSQQPDAAGGSAGGDEPTQDRVLQDELDRCRDLLLRTAAEFDNYRKRTERERREQADRSVSDLLLELLPVLDDFERALSADVSRESTDAHRQGVELIHRQLLDLLKRRGVRPIDAVGTEFDPHVHQAVTTEVVEGGRDGEVIEELRRGYMIGERLLRPAMVKVART